jgi:hypothetical protein
MLSYLVRVLKGQAEDPLCRECRAYAGTLEFARAQAGALREAGAAEMASLAEAWLAGLAVPPEPVPQRKLGNCRLPGGRCLVKHSKAVFSEE